MAPPNKMPRAFHDSKSGNLSDHEDNATVPDVDDEVDPTATDHPVALKMPKVVHRTGTGSTDGHEENTTTLGNETEVDPTATDHQPPKSGN